MLTKMSQVTIEINTNLPKKENREKEDKDEGREESGEKHRQTFEFKLPAELLQ